MRTKGRRKKAVKRARDPSVEQQPALVTGTVEEDTDKDKDKDKDTDKDKDKDKDIEREMVNRTYCSLKGNLKALPVWVLTSNLLGSVLDHVET